MMAVPGNPGQPRPAMAPAPLGVIRTQFMGYSAEFSPFQSHRLAVATAQYYGVVGNGRQYVIDVHDGGKMEVIAAFDSQDGLFDCCWSELNDAHLLSASGDGSLKLWDLRSQANPLRGYHEHTAEVYSVHWNQISKETFVSGAWDNLIKLWNPERPGSLQTFRGHSGCIYSTRWSPRQESVFASTSGDCFLNVWDYKASPHPVMSIRAHDHEILTCDWNKYNENVLVTGSVDRSIRIIDVRTQKPLHILQGHDFAVRRVKCSPHHETVVASASYDMSLRVWNYAIENSMIARFDHHSEFVLGVDFNMFNPGQIASCSWDESVAILQVPFQQ